MKKIISLILCLMLSVVILSGCSTNELAYVDLINETIDLEATDVSGTIVVETPETLEISFSGEANLKDLYANLKVNLSAKTPKKKITINDANVIWNGEELFVEKTLVKGLLERKQTESYIRQFDAYYRDKKYISFKQENLLKDHQLLKQALYENEINAINTYFEEYKFKIVDTAETMDGYTLSVDYKDILRLSESLTEYLYKNKTALFDNESNKSLRNKLNVIYNNELEKTLTEEEYKKVKDKAIETFSKYNGSQIEHTIGKYQNKYKNNLLIKIIENQEELLKLKANLILTKKDFVEKITLIEEDFAQYTPDNFNITNGADKIKVYWEKENTIADVHIYNNDIITEETTYNLILKDDRIYLPLRAICEKLGETVEWDSVNSKAYIVRGNNKIDMTGMVVDGRTMLKVRDFEKLNYRISYTLDEYGLSIATIEK